MPAEWRVYFRKKNGIVVDGEDIPPPLPRFVVRKNYFADAIDAQDMKLCSALVQALADKKIATPTAIQMQGIPVALTVI